MAQAFATGKHRAVPLEITPEAHEQLTPFRERTFRAMYDAAMADGGAEVIENATIILRDSLHDEDEAVLSLACWMDSSWEDAEKVHRRIVARILDLFPTWTEAECEDYAHMVSFSVNPAL